MPRCAVCSVAATALAVTFDGEGTGGSCVGHRQGRHRRRGLQGQ